MGLRAGEVVKLELEDIDWDNALITISGKGGQRAQLPLPPDVGRADHEFLLKMQLELDPGASPFPGFVPGTGAFMLSCLRNNSIGLTRFDTTPNKKEVIDQVEEYFGRRTERESPGLTSGRDLVIAG